MAASAITKSTALITGVALAYQAANVDGNYIVNTTGRVILHAKNGSGGAITVTVNSQQQCDQGGDHDLVVSVGAGADKMIGPLTTARYNDTDGRVQITYSGVTSLTVAAIDQ